MKKLLLFVALSLTALWGATAQDLKVKGLEGQAVSFSELVNSETPTIVTFWATWCKPCQKELEALKDLEDEWRGKVRIVAISIDDARSQAKVPALVKSKGLPFMFYSDPNQELFKFLGGSTVPFAMLYHKGERITLHTGYTPGDEEILLEKAYSLSN